MKILFAYTENYIQGGGNRYMTDSLNAIHELYDKIVICSNKNGLFNADFKRLEFDYSYVSLPLMTFDQIFIHSKIIEKAYTRIPVKLLFLFFSPLLFVYHLFLLAKTVRKFKISQIISFNGGYPAADTPLLMLIVAKFLGIKNALSIPSYPIKRFFLMDYFLDKIVEFCVDKIIVNAQTIKNGMSEIRFFSEKKIFVVHSCLKNKDLSPYKGTFPKEIKIGYSGRLDIEKGILYLLDAFIELIPIFPNIRLTLVGKGTAVAPVKQKIAKLKPEWQNYITLPGFYETEKDIDSFTETFDIYVFASFHEGFPYSILEAMRLGRAIISTNVGGVSEAVEHQKTGLLIAPYSVEEIKNAVSILIKDNDLRMFLANQAREKFLTHFQYIKMKDNLISIFS